SSRSGHLDHDVRRLDHAHDRAAGAKAKLRGGFRGHEADESMGAGLDLDHRGHAVLGHARDDPGEPVTRGLRHDPPGPCLRAPLGLKPAQSRSEEHTSELQSPYELVCRLLLEKKKYDTIRLR